MMQQPSDHTGKRKSLGSARIFQQSIQSIEGGGPEERGLSAETKQKKESEHDSSEIKDLEKRHCRSNSGRSSQQRHRRPKGKLNDRFTQGHLTPQSSENLSSGGEKKTPPESSVIARQWQRPGKGQQASQARTLEQSSGETPCDSAVQISDSVAIAQLPGGQRSGSGAGEQRQPMDSARSSQNSTPVTDTGLVFRGHRGRGRHLGREQRSAEQGSANSVRLGRGRHDGNQSQKPGLGVHWLPVGQSDTDAGCSSVVQPSGGNLSHGNNARVKACQSLSSLSNQSLETPHSSLSLSNQTVDTPRSGLCQLQQDSSSAKGNVQPQVPNTAAGISGRGKLPSLVSCPRNATLSVNNADVSFESMGMNPASTNCSRRYHRHDRGKHVERRGGRQAKMFEEQNLQACLDNTSGERGASEKRFKKKHKKKSKKHRFGGKDISQSSSFSTTSLERSDVERDRPGKQEMDDVGPSARNVVKAVATAATADPGRCHSRQNLGLSKPRPASQTGPRKSPGMDQRYPCPPRFACWGRGKQDIGQGFRRGNDQQLPQQNSQFGQHGGSAKSSMNEGMLGRMNTGSGDEANASSSEKLEVANSEKRHGQDVMSVHSTSIESSKIGSTRLPEHDSMKLTSEMRTGASKSQNNYENENCSHIERFADENAMQQPRESVEQVSGPDKAPLKCERNRDHTPAKPSAVKLLSREDMMLTSQDYRMQELPPGFTMLRYQVASPPRSVDHSAAHPRDATDGPIMESALKETNTKTQIEEQKDGNGYMPDDPQDHEDGTGIDEISQSKACKILSGMAPNTVKDGSNNEDTGWCCTEVTADNLSRWNAKDLDSEVATGSYNPMFRNELNSHIKCVLSPAVHDQCSGTVGSSERFPERSKSDTLIQCQRPGSSDGRGISYLVDVPYPDRCRVQEDGFSSQPASTRSTCFLSADESWETPVQPGLACQAGEGMTQDSGSLATDGRHPQTTREHGQLLGEKMSKSVESKAGNKPISRILGQICFAETEDCNYNMKAVEKSSQSLQDMDLSQGFKWNRGHAQHPRGQVMSHQFSDACTSSDAETLAPAGCQPDGNGTVTVTKKQNTDTVPNWARCTSKEPTWPKSVMPASDTSGTFDTLEICTDIETQHASAFSNSKTSPSFSCSMPGSYELSQDEAQAPGLEMRKHTAYCDREGSAAVPIENDGTAVDVCDDPLSALEEMLPSVSRGRGRRQHTVKEEQRVTSNSSCQLQVLSFREAHEKELRFLQGAGFGIPQSSLSQSKNPCSPRNASSPRSNPSLNHGSPCSVHQTPTRIYSQPDETLLPNVPSGTKKCTPTVHAGTHLENLRNGTKSTTENDCKLGESGNIASRLSNSLPATTDLQLATGDGASHISKLLLPSLPKCTANHEKACSKSGMLSAGFDSEQLKCRQHGTALQICHSGIPQNYTINEGSSGDEYIDPSLAMFSDSGDAQSQSPLKSDRNQPFRHPGDSCPFHKPTGTAQSTNWNTNMKQPKNSRSQSVHSTTSAEGDFDSWKQNKRAEMKNSATRESLNLQPAGQAYESVLDCRSTSGYSVDTEGEISVEGSQEDLDLDWRQTCNFPRPPLFLHQTLPPPHWDRNPGSSQPFSLWQDQTNPHLPRISRPPPAPALAHPSHPLHPHKAKATPVLQPSWSFTLEGCQAEAEVNNLLWQVKACLQPQRSQPASITVVNYQVIPNESGLDILIRKKYVPWDTPQSEWWRHGPVPGMNPQSEWSHVASQHAEWSNHSPLPSRSSKSEHFYPGTPPSNQTPVPMPSRQQQQAYPDWQTGFGERYPTGRCQTGLFPKSDMPDTEDTRSLNASTVLRNSSIDGVGDSADHHHHPSIPRHLTPDSTVRLDNTASPGASAGSLSQPHQPLRSACYCVARSLSDVCSCSVPPAGVTPDTLQGPRPGHGRKRPPSQMPEGEGLPSQHPRRGPSQDWWSPPADKESYFHTSKSWLQPQHSPIGAGEGGRAGRDGLENPPTAWYPPIPGTLGGGRATPCRPSVFACSPGSRGVPPRMSAVTAVTRMQEYKMPGTPGHSSSSPCQVPSLWRQQPALAVQSPDLLDTNQPLNTSDLNLDNTSSTAEMGTVEPETSLRWKNFCNDLQRRCQRYTVTFVDSHCHLDFIFNREPFQGSFWNFCQRNRDSMPSNFEGCISIFCNPSSFSLRVGLWQNLTQENNVWLAFGCHPKQVLGFNTMHEENLAKIVQHPRVVAVGEMGLDFSKPCFVKQAEQQKQVFRRQIELALAVGKPLIIHSRDAEDECLAILIEMVPRHYKIHCHCFTASWEKACQWLEAFPNLCLGLTPLVTFRSATSTRNVARQIPLNRLLLETDSPYFIPQSAPRECMRLSHPGMAIFVAEEVAFLKSISVNEVLAACRKNTRDLFGI